MSQLAEMPQVGTRALIYGPAPLVGYPETINCDKFIGTVH